MVCVRCLLAGVGGDNHWRRHIFPGFRPHSPRPPACLSGEGAVSAPPRQGRLPRLRAPGCPRAALLMSGRAGQRKHRNLSPAPAGSGPRSTAVLGGASMAPDHDLRQGLDGSLSPQDRMVASASRQMNESHKCSARHFHTLHCVCCRSDFLAHGTWLLA